MFEIALVGFVFLKRFIDSLHAGCINVERPYGDTTNSSNLLTSTTIMEKAKSLIDSMKSTLSTRTGQSQATHYEPSGERHRPPTLPRLGAFEPFSEAISAQIPLVASRGQHIPLNTLQRSRSPLPRLEAASSFAESTLSQSSDIR